MEFFKDENFNEDAKVKVGSVIEWMKKNAEFKGNTDVGFVWLFLKCCDMDEELTMERMLNYYTYRQSFPRLMINRDFLDKRCQHIYDNCVVTSDLNNEDSAFPLVILFRLKNILPEQDIYDASRLLVLGLESGVRESKRTREEGVIAVIDLADMGISIACKFTPALFKQLVLCILNGVAFKMKQFHVINVGVVAAAVVRTAVFFLPNRLRKILYIHSGSYECLSDYVPLQHLPAECGGTNGTAHDNNEYLRPILMKWRAHLLEDEKFGF